MPKRIDWNEYDHLIGTMTDSELASIIGCSTSSVGNRRVFLGIEAQNPHRRKLFTATEFLGHFAKSKHGYARHELVDIFPYASKLLHDYVKKGLLSSDNLSRNRTYFLTLKGRAYYVKCKAIVDSKDEKRPAEVQYVGIHATTSLLILEKISQRGGLTYREIREGFKVEVAAVIHRLKKKGYLSQPEGKYSGFYVTEAGREYLARFSTLD